MSEWRKARLPGQTSSNFVTFFPLVTFACRGSLPSGGSFCQDFSEILDQIDRSPGLGINKQSFSDFNPHSNSTTSFDSNATTDHSQDST